MHYTETIHTRDRHALVVREYRPSNGDVRRTLIIVHGLCENGQRYDRVAERMVWYGWRVLIADQRGHGKSDGVSLHVDDFRQYVHDLQAVYEHFDCNPCSTAILGHSMGGLVSVRFAQALQERVAALVLLSPLLAVKVRIPWYLRILSFLFGRLISTVVPRWRFDSRLSRADTARSPLIEPRQPSGRQSVTLRWFVAMQAARKRAWREATRVRLPVLVLQAGHDRIVDPLAPGRWLAHISSPDKTLRHIPHAFHELLSEPDWGQTLAYVADWLGRRVRPFEKTATTSGRPTRLPCGSSWPGTVLAG